MTEIKLYVLLKLKKKCKDFFQITILNILGNMKPEHLKKMRELSGLTQVQLGELLGFILTPSTKNKERFECSTISQYENGYIKKIPFDFAQRWASFCGFDIVSDVEIKVSTDSYFKLVEESEKYQNILKIIHE